MAQTNDVNTIDFCTLGMFIIDDIYPPPSAEDQIPHRDVIGGAGTYSAIGARLLSPPPYLSSSIGWIVDKGTDFPPSISDELASWRTHLILRQRPNDELTTRGWNGYTANEHRDFKYLTTKKRLTPDDLTPDLLQAKSFHLICSPGRCVEMVRSLHDLRRSHGYHEAHAKPIIIWEPVPDMCIPSELPNLYKALEYIDVISPNHEELAALFNFTHPSSGPIDRSAVERQSNELLARGIGADSSGAIVVRAGKEGCFVASLNTRRWLPAYHQDSSRVVDPTGGGNGFLGGFAVGLVRAEASRGEKWDLVSAARHGSVAAGFCIEQVGVPKLETVVESRTCVDEVWNGESVMDRLEEYRRRTSDL